MFDLPDYDQHEEVHFFEDRDSGLRCIIAIHSSALGPAAGGTRMWDYASGAEMLTDALRLSKGMSYKTAMADIPFGGGKGVIWGNSRTDKSEALFEAYGVAIEKLGGRYYTAEDVGISTDDIAIAARKTKYAAGLVTEDTGSGDPSPITAQGIQRGIETACARVFGNEDLNGRTVAVQGVGHVGGYVCDRLAAAGAQLVICDIDEETLQEVARRTGARIVSTDEIYDVDADIFSPNALGAILNETTVPRLKARIVAGGANNQLSTPDIGVRLAEAGILYAPDYVINGGGIINVAAELSGSYSRAWVDQKIEGLAETLGAVFDEALSGNTPTSEVADRTARARIAAARNRT